MLTNELMRFLEQYAITQEFILLVLIFVFNHSKNVFSKWLNGMKSHISSLASSSMSFVRSLVPFIVVHTPDFVTFKLQMSSMIRAELS